MAFLYLKLPAECPVPRRSLKLVAHLPPYHLPLLTVAWMDQGGTEEVLSVKCKEELTLRFTYNLVSDASLNLFLP